MWSRFLENASTNAHGLYTELPDKLKGNHSIIWWTIQSAIMVGSSSNVTTRAVSQAYVCLFQHQKVPTHQCSPTWSSMCQVMTIPQDQQPWLYTHPLSSAGIPSPPSHCHRPKFAEVNACETKIWSAAKAMTDTHEWHTFKHIHMDVYDASKQASDITNNYISYINTGRIHILYT